MTEIVRSLRVAVANDLARENTAGFADDDLRQLANAMLARHLEDLADESRRKGHDPMSFDDEETLRHRVLDAMFGLGALQCLVDDETVENIDVNGPHEVFVTRADGTKTRAEPVADSDQELIELVRSVAARLGLAERPFDAANPMLDLALPDGSRLSAVLGLAKHPSISIRRHRFADVSLADEVSFGLCDEHLASFLAAAVRAKRNILVSGRTNSGKTTLLRALVNEVDPSERIITIESALELGLDRLAERHPDVVALEARVANTEGAGEVTLAELVRRSLRMNPDRVIVGETLGPEIVSLLNAMSQGYGSLATIHAESSAGVFTRIASYAAQAAERLPIESTNLLIAGSVHFVVHIAAKPEAQLGLDDRGALVEGPGTRLARYVSSIREVVGAEERMVVSNEIFRPGADGRAVQGAPLRSETYEELVANGYEPGDVR